jgi:hypothetical protein
MNEQQSIEQYEGLALAEQQADADFALRQADVMEELEQWYATDSEEDAVRERDWLDDYFDGDDEVAYL